jgi:hypothetical protein
MQKVKEKALKRITSKIRHQMIAEAAYYRAEHRRFQEGDVLQDWLEAEREIDLMYFQSSQRRSALIFLPDN